MDDGTIYSDLLKAFVKNGHRVFAVSPNERRYKAKTAFSTDGDFGLLKVRTGNLQKCNFIEKGIATLLVERQYIRAIKKYLSNVVFDLVIYSTPPITFANAVNYVKKRDNAKTYLLLKDIFPQNAVDIGVLKKNGIKGFLYRYFRKKEKKLYAFSDRIGCMSEANRKYLLANNPEIPYEKVEICPNSIEVRDLQLDAAEKSEIRKRYGIPENATVFVYGGNLGKPQGIGFIADCLRKAKCVDNVFFLIVGSGTEYHRLEQFVEAERPSNVLLMKSIPKCDYDKMIVACDVGLIFLDYRFSIPNFPSRLLSYMQAKIPILACVDPNTDVGAVVEAAGAGYCCLSNDVDGFVNAVKKLCVCDRAKMGENAWRYLNDNYTAEQGYRIITKNQKIK